VALVLTRQNLPTLDRTKYAAASGVAKGAYVIADADGGKPELILMGTGSELSLCIDAYEKLKAEGIKARVVSMPSWDIFEQQDAAYKESVLPSSVTARVSVEMASTMGWGRYVGLKGRMVGMHRFGASAPLKDLLKFFGFTVEKVVEEARKALAEQ
jgi:transketolase